MAYIEETLNVVSLFVIHSTHRTNACASNCNYWLFFKKIYIYNNIYHKSKETER